LIFLWSALFYSFDYRPKLEATRAIEKFHKQMNDGEFSQIRDDAGTYSSQGRAARSGLPLWEKFEIPLENVSP
jgi:hypothetical protein